MEVTEGVENEESEYRKGKEGVRRQEVEKGGSGESSGKECGDAG